MKLSPSEREVDDYFTRATPGYYQQGWDPDHLHFGLFDPARNPDYEEDPRSALADRRPAVARMLSRILTPADIQPGERVVDAGCGVGGTAIVLASQGCRVTGLNFNALQLELAKAKAREAQVEVEFLWANCSHSLPLPDASVDVVVNIESACHYFDRPRFFAEVSRILKPGGRIAAQDWVAAEDLQPQDACRLEALARAWHLAPPLESLASYRRLLNQNGLAMVESEWLGDEVRANGLILAQGWRELRSLPEVLLNAGQKERREQARTFADTFLSGLLGLGVYLAVKQ